MQLTFALSNLIHIHHLKPRRLRGFFILQLSHNHVFIYHTAVHKYIRLTAKNSVTSYGLRELFYSALKRCIEVITL
jgi:hypothetical protein